VAKWLGVVALLAGALAAGCGVGHVARSSLDQPAAAEQPHSSPAATPPASQRKPQQTPARTPAPPVNHCAGNRSGQLVLVSIARQHAWLCRGTRTVYNTAVTTGMATADTRTPTGSYRIEGRNKNSVLTLSNGDQYSVNYWIPFDAPMFGFHDSSWQKFPYGSAKYKTDGSHGCVHLPLPAMKFLYDWVRIGAKVDIRA
jgi:lipoprotein-anchoring transpeptidase ErfK/SrfK